MVSRFQVIWTICMAALAGCTLGPDYQRPPAMLKADGYAAAPADVSYAAADVSRWWERMDDALMDRYVGILLDQNLQLREAAARVHQAWAQLGIQKGGRWPGVSASISGSRQMQPLNETFAPSGIPLAGGFDVERFYTTQWQAGLSTQWQVDLFGRVRRSIESAQARFEAARTDAAALLHSLIAQLARTRVAMATLKRRADFARETVQSRRLTLDVVNRRYRSGVADTSAVDVYLARENLASAQADLVDLRRQLVEQAYQLDVLMGRRPGITDPSEIDMPLLPPPRRPPVGLPAQLLDRRPDLVSAELRLKAATADIGVAIADLYPDLTLSGAIGYQDNELRKSWFDSSNLFGSIVGDLMLRIFEGGRLRANIDLQEARAEELSAAYARLILNALLEVETALNDGLFIASRLDELQRQLESIRKAEELAWNNYRRGLLSLLDFLEVQRRRYLAEQTYLLAAQAAWNSRIALYLALGGDWLESGESR